MSMSTGDAQVGHSVPSGRVPVGAFVMFRDVLWRVSGHAPDGKVELTFGPKDQETVVRVDGDVKLLVVQLPSSEAQ